MIKVLNLLPFVKTDRGDIGIAQDGTFAATAWRISDTAYNQVSGYKFSWIAPDGQSYIDDRIIFNRPTEEEVLKSITPALQHIALEEGLIEISMEE